MESRSLGDIEDARFRAAIEDMARRDPERLDRFLQELSEEVDAVRASPASAEADEGVRALRDALPDRLLPALRAPRHGRERWCRRSERLTVVLVVAVLAGIAAIWMTRRQARQS
ncbi:MAG: hypothetical protein R2712_23815 [Vicinamibacterales bacterium]